MIINNIYSYIVLKNANILLDFYLLIVYDRHDYIIINVFFIKSFLFNVTMNINIFIICFFKLNSHVLVIFQTMFTYDSFSGGLSITFRVFLKHQ